jgi:DNA-binding MarR family transcriptional regulator
MTARDDPNACARAWAALTSAHNRVADRLSEALKRSCGLSINDFEILLRLDRAPRPGLRLGDLCPAVRLTQPSLSRTVTRLADRGWVERTGDPSDRRGVLVTLTSSGRATLRKAVPVHARTIREVLLDRLSPAEQDLLATVLTRVAAA